jgi:hypothetical protein
VLEINYLNFPLKKLGRGRRVNKTKKKSRKKITVKIKECDKLENKGKNENINQIFVINKA